MSFEVRNLVKSYGDKVVVDHLNLTMAEPGVYALLGTNGAGKTTSIRMILGMLQKDSGEVLFNGEEMQPKQMNIGYLAEERGLYPKYPIIDQLLYFARLKGVKRSEAMKRVKYWSSRLELDEYLFPPKNSKGKAPKPKLADQLSKGTDGFVLQGNYSVISGFYSRRTWGQEGIKSEWKKILSMQMCIKTGVSKLTNRNMRKKKQMLAQC